MPARRPGEETLRRRRCRRPALGSPCCAKAATRGNDPWCRAANPARRPAPACARRPSGARVRAGAPCGGWPAQAVPGARAKSPDRPPPRHTAAAPCSRCRSRRWSASLPTRRCRRCCTPQPAPALPGPSSRWVARRAAGRHRVLSWQKSDGAATRPSVPAPRRSAPAGKGGTGSRRQRLSRPDDRWRKARWRHRARRPVPVWCRSVTGAVPEPVPGSARTPAPAAARRAPAPIRRAWKEGATTKSDGAVRVRHAWAPPPRTASCGCAPPARESAATAAPAPRAAPAGCRYWPRDSPSRTGARSADRVPPRSRLPGCRRWVRGLARAAARRSAAAAGRDPRWRQPRRCCRPESGP